MRTAEIRNQKSEIRNRKSARALTSDRRPPTSSSRGVTIVEVLFAILITTVGLLGAIAIFPVASAQAKKARDNDTMANSGRSAVHSFDTYDMRDPEKWFYWVPTGLTPAQFTKVFTGGGSLATTSYCLDTRSVVANTGTWTNIRTFPYTPLNTSFLTPTSYMNRVAFFPGALAPGTAVDARDQFDRANTSATRNTFLADMMFQLDDDLLFLRPGLDDVSNLGLSGIKNDRSVPAIQQFDWSGTPYASAAQKRLSQGHMSWMATLVPRVDLSQSPSLASDEYNLSIVVFNDRPTDLRLTAFASGGNENLLERVVVCQVAPGSAGDSGGEVLISWTAAQTTANTQTAEERLKVRANNWIMLMWAEAGVGRFQWYRVTQVDAEIDYGNNLSGAYSRFVSLIGPDLPSSVVSAPAQALLMDGVVAVHEKSVKLDFN